MRNCEYKNCIYPVFRTDKKTGKGWCSYHWKSQSTDIDKRSPIQKHLSKMKAKNKENGVVVDEKSDLDKWFDNIIETTLKRFPYCDNCGEHIPEKYYRHAIAHIFPKNIFRSIATHEYNFIIAGAGCGCHNETHRLDTFSKMEIFSVAVLKFSKFKDAITEKHKYLDEFKKYAKWTQ